MIQYWWEQQLIWIIRIIPLLETDYSIGSINNIHKRNKMEYISPLMVISIPLKLIMWVSLMMNG